MFGDLLNNNTLMKDDDHPEVDTSIPLCYEENLIYKMIIGILNWVVFMGRIDLLFTV